MHRLPTITVSDFPAKGNTLTVREIVELARLAEGDGIDRFGVTDFPYYYDCITTITACLAATERLIVESLVTTPYARHPEATACAFATMSDFSGGRVILGVGGGVEEPSNVWVEPWGHARPRPLRAMRELVGLCRTMWGGKTTPTTGEVMRGSGLALRFPLRHPVPVLIAARGPQMLRLAGELADIVHIAAPYLGVDYISGCLAEIEAGIARSGRKPDEVEIDLTVSACPMRDAAEARALAKITTGAGILWMSGAEKYARLRPNWTIPAELDVPRELVERLASGWDMWSGEDLPDDLAAMIDDAVLSQFSIAGGPDECSHRMVELVDRFPRVTGIRLKLPPLSGPESYGRYREMVACVGEIRRGWQGGESVATQAPVGAGR